METKIEQFGYLCDALSALDDLTDNLELDDDDNNIVEFIQKQINKAIVSGVKELVDYQREHTHVNIITKS